MKTLTTLPRVYVSDDTFPHSFGDLAALSEEIRRLQVQRYALEVADMFSHGVHALSFDRDENGGLYLTVRYDAAPTKYFSSGEDPHFDVELDPSDIEDAVDWAMLYPHLPGRGDLLSDSLPSFLESAFDGRYQEYLAERQRLVLQEVAGEVNVQSGVKPRF